MKETFYSNGKLLITGEYVVLNGAKAFALPTKFGQKLIVDQAEGQAIYWKSYDHDGSIWFEDTISFSSVLQKERFGKGNQVKNTLIEILHEAYLLNPSFITNSKGYSIKTELTFPKLWGLGTSSTVINNIAQWLKIDAFELLKKSLGGSGYDIACAQNDTAILYQIVNEKPTVEVIDFRPSFTDKIFFVYLNKKQSSKEAIVSYLNNAGDVQKTILTIDEITKTIVETSQFNEFAAALQQHEIVLSELLKLITVQELLFEDFDGVVKSLGAWGGDFVIAVAQENPTGYFKAKGYEVVVPYRDMIL